MYIHVCWKAHFMQIQCHFMHHYVNKHTCTCTCVHYTNTVFLTADIGWNLHLSHMIPLHESRQLVSMMYNVHNMIEFHSHL